jgi:hypothetical protein
LLKDVAMPPFRKGYDPRRNVTQGRRKTASPTARELAQLERSESMRKIVALRDGAEDEGIQLRAAIYLLDRADGRPPAAPAVPVTVASEPEDDAADILRLLVPALPSESIEVPPPIESEPIP